MNEPIQRFDIFMADFSGVRGSEQGGAQRPVICVSNDICNKFSPVITVAAITSQLKKKRLPTHVQLDKDKYNLPLESFIMMEQLRSIDKSRLLFKITSITENDPIVNEINSAMMIQLGLVDIPVRQPQTSRPLVAV